MPTSLSPHFTLEELTISQTAVRKGIDNTPTLEVCTNLEALCGNVLERIRDLVCAPIVISSGFRSLALNRRVGGRAIRSTSAAKRRTSRVRI
jgi:hypothetical protein